jgi:hypothetical protein
MIQLLGSLVAAIVLAACIACPIDHRGRGRHVSRPLARLAGLDTGGVLLAQVLWLVAAAATVIALGPSLAALIMEVTLGGWFLDDWATGGSDDEPRRKHHPFKVKIRMPAVVHLRPVERVPAPAA